MDVKAICPLCGTEFRRSPALLARGKGYCTRACADQAQRGRRHTEEARARMRAGIKRTRTVVALSCEQCGTTFERPPVYVARTQHHFCSRTCAVAWRRGERVSNWKGDAASKQAARVRAITTFPRRPCEDCGADPPGRLLHRHHVDLNPWNNAPENIRFLCASCHHRVHTEIRRSGRAS